MKFPSKIKAHCLIQSRYTWDKLPIWALTLPLMMAEPSGDQARSCTSSACPPRSCPAMRQSAGRSSAAAQGGMPGSQAQDHAYYLCEVHAVTERMTRTICPKIHNGSLD